MPIDLPLGQTTWNPKDWWFVVHVFPDSKGAFSGSMLVFGSVSQVNGGILEKHYEFGSCQGVLSTTGLPKWDHPRMDFGGFILSDFVTSHLSVFWKCPRLKRVVQNKSLRAFTWKCLTFLLIGLTKWFPNWLLSISHWGGIGPLPRSPRILRSLMMVSITGSSKVHRPWRLGLLLPLGTKTTQMFARFDDTGI